MTDRIHTCSYYCHHAACIKAQRDELRDKYVETKNTHRVVSVEFLEEINNRYMLNDLKMKIRAIIEDKGAT